MFADRSPLAAIGGGGRGASTRISSPTVLKIAPRSRRDQIDAFTLPFATALAPRGTTDVAAYRTSGASAGDRLIRSAKLSHAAAMASRDALLGSSVALLARSRQAAAKPLYSSCLFTRLAPIDSDRQRKSKAGVHAYFQCTAAMSRIFGGFDARRRLESRGRSESIFGRPSCLPASCVRPNSRQWGFI